ncbi:MAG: PCP reductase family protein, partial [Acidobacteriota bacterium]|nr:PCP reductase family protein [Acidobacteriota bacterium]
REAYRALSRTGGQLRMFSHHLPAVMTWQAGRLFPVNCGTKGVGFMPKGEHLSKYIEMFERVLRDTRDEAPGETLERRLQTVASFYFSDEVEHRAMTGLEIFKRGTHSNLCANPLASLLFTGAGPQYRSFQLNCAVEMTSPGDPRHQFIVLARTMFERDSFHITQQRFPHAYIYWITELLDKTPFHVVQVGEKVHVSASGIEWERKALALITHAPEIIQDFIKTKVEEHARELGSRRITPALVEQVRERYMGPR